MNCKVFFLVIIFLAHFSANAQTNPTISCEDILVKLESGELSDTSFYDKCGFNDEVTVWNKWAGYVSQQKMKKALFEICDRFPLHEYHEIYCEKSATLGYGPALARVGEIYFKKNDVDNGMKYFVQALESQQLSEEQEGRLLETLGFYYFKINDKKAVSYLEKAAIRRAALSNNILGYLLFSQKETNEADDKKAFEYFWRSILLGCSSAEENLGLFQLTRLKKITKEMAVKQMSKNVDTCDVLVEAEKKETISDDFLSCRCKTSLENEERFNLKPYLLVKVEASRALLKMKNGKEILVSQDENLPDGGRVFQIRKTAVILTYPKEKREILNLYLPDRCVSFCQEEGISENLSSREMQKRITGAAGIKIKPYRVSFNQQECDSIRYYAPLLVDVDKPYTGKEECSIDKKAQDVILDNLSSDMQTETNFSKTPSTQSDDLKALSTKEKQKLYELGEDLIKGKIR